MRIRLKKYKFADATGRNVTIKDKTSKSAQKRARVLGYSPRKQK